MRRFALPASLAVAFVPVCLSIVASCEDHSYIPIPVYEAGIPPVAPDAVAPDAQPAEAGADAEAGDAADATSEAAPVGDGAADGPADAATGG